MLKILFFFFIFMSPSSFASDEIQPIIKEYKGILDKKYILLPHRGTYLLPFSYNENPNNKVYDKALDSGLLSERGQYVKKQEIEFQVSFAILTNRNVFNSDLNIFLGYTHTSWWQIYNKGWSRQFRETNYTPELFARKVFKEPPKVFGLNLLAYDFGYIHQSNGQSQELSRTWDRLFFRIAFGIRHFLFVTDLWTRIRIMDKKLDDNPNIQDYRGYGEFSIKYWDQKNILTLKMVPGKKYFGSELSYSYPWKEGLRFFIKTNYGYGHSLIDNENKEKRVGVGVILSNFLSMN